MVRFEIESKTRQAFKVKLRDMFSAISRHPINVVRKTTPTYSLIKSVIVQLGNKETPS